MFSGNDSFFGIVNTPLVRYGEDTKLRGKEHTAGAVYCEMLLQIARDYSSLPDVRTLLASDIRFFYDGLRSELKEHTKPKG